MEKNTKSEMGLFDSGFDFLYSSFEMNLFNTSVL